jgi:hypothetical protein
MLYLQVGWMSLLLPDPTLGCALCATGLAAAAYLGKTPPTVYITIFPPFLSVLNTWLGSYFILRILNFVARPDLSFFYES